jgi:hypothetical protein
VFILRGLVSARQILWIIAMALQVGLVVRLLFLGRERYRWFLLYLVVSLLGALYLLSVPVRSSRYTISWIAVETSTPVLLYAAALEIYSNLVQSFGGVDRQGKIVLYLRRVLNGVMLLSLIVCLGLAVFDARSLTGEPGFSLRIVLSAVLLLQRIATSTLALFLAGTALYFARFRLSLPRNLGVHGFFFTAWMIVSACALFWRNLETQSATIINVAFLSASILIFGLWIVMLSNAGESVPVRSPASDDRRQADREILISFLRKLTRQR